MEGGLLTIIAMVILAPFQMWRERAKEFAQLPPVEQNLQRASHGFAVMVLSVKVPVSLFGLKQVFAFFPSLVTAPREAALGLVFFGTAVYGLVRFIVGWRRYCGMRMNDPMLAARAFWTMAAGFIGVLWLVSYLEHTFELTGPWWEFGLWVLRTVAWWLALSRAVQFVLLAIGGSNALNKLLGYLKERNRRRKPGKPNR